MMKTLTPGSREWLLDLLLERALDLLMEGGENDIKALLRRGQRGYATLTDEELWREATSSLGFAPDDPALAGLLAEPDDDGASGSRPAAAMPDPRQTPNALGPAPAPPTPSGLARWGRVEQRLRAMVDRHLAVIAGARASLRDLAEAAAGLLAWVKDHGADPEAVRGLEALHRQALATVGR